MNSWQASCWHQLVAHVDPRLLSDYARQVTHSVFYTHLANVTVSPYKKSQYSSLYIEDFSNIHSHTSVLGTLSLIKASTMIKLWEKRVPTSPSYAILIKASTMIKPWGRVVVTLTWSQFSGCSITLTYVLPAIFSPTLCQMQYQLKSCSADLHGSINYDQ